MVIMVIKNGYYGYKKMVFMVINNGYYGDKNRFYGDKKWLLW